MTITGTAVLRAATWASAGLLGVGGLVVVTGAAGGLGVRPPATARQTGLDAAAAPAGLDGAGLDGAGLDGAGLDPLGVDLLALVEPAGRPGAPGGPAAAYGDKHDRQRERQRDGRAAKRRGGMPGRALHGEVTVQTRDGFREARFQRGEVTAVSATSVTVRSPDGFTRSYPVAAETAVRKDGRRAAVGDVRVGDRVGVVALKDGAQYVTRVIVVRTPKAGRPDRPGRR